MKYVAIFEYGQGKDNIAEVRPLHGQYLKGLLEKGQLVMAGPFTDGSGAMIVYEAASSEDAERMIQNDPFHQRGVFGRYQVRPWNPAMANPALVG